MIGNILQPMVPCLLWLYYVQHYAYTNGLPSHWSGQCNISRLFLIEECRYSTYPKIRLKTKRGNLISEIASSLRRGGRIRTYDPLVPNQVRYRTALHPAISYSHSIGVAGLEPVTLPIQNRDALPDCATPRNILFPFNRGGRIRTCDPPDSKSGCATPRTFWHFCLQVVFSKVPPAFLSGAKVLEKNSIRKTILNLFITKKETNCQSSQNQ